MATKPKTPQLSIKSKLILNGLSEAFSQENDPLKAGIFLRFKATQSGPKHTFKLGSLEKLARFTACHRYEPFWMKPAAGTKTQEIPIETQSLLFERSDQSCVLIIPLVGKAFRSSIQGSKDNQLELVAETNDPWTHGTEDLACFIAIGDDPYELIEKSARSVCAKLGTGRLRTEKPVPAFVDLFGWCTWDAFYGDVSHDKVREGLESFAKGGIKPQALILDDGWQSVERKASGERRLTAFKANEKFPGDLGPTVKMSKEEFGIKEFMVWHAFHGYWGGVDPQALPGYDVKDVLRHYSSGINHHVPQLTEWFGNSIGMVSKEAIYRFFQDYHRHLREQGVDGVKVDNQAAVEGVAHGNGGRVALMKAYREALEGSVNVHFNGALINCMSCANEMIYGTMASTVVRTSTDFWPKRPESHGLHLYTNAQVSAWFGEFVQPDWDMFQSGHEMGPYHAAGRAVGGCPVYVSDKPNVHNFDLIKKLICSDGTVLRAIHNGRPTRDCLFRDPMRENVLLKIFNFNTLPGTAVLGAFNAQYHEKKNARVKVRGTVSPRDIPGLKMGEYAVYAHQSKTLRRMKFVENWRIELPELAFEIFTFCSLINGVGVIGLADKFNSSGAIVRRGWHGDRVFDVELRDGGEFLAYSAKAPKSSSLNGKPLEIKYNIKTGALSAHVTPDAKGRVKVKLEY